jgi:hypothetical protein
VEIDDFSSVLSNFHNYYFFKKLV